MGAAEDAQADQVNALVRRGTGELLRGDPDALVDDLEARVASAECDLFGAVGVTVEAGLSHEELRPAAEPVLESDDLFAERFERDGISRDRASPGDAGGSSVFAEGLSQSAAPLSGGDTRFCSRDG